MHQQKAFTLVEMSIVIVIIGLLAGAVLAGQSLVRASEVRSVITGFHKYVTASATFQDKYGALAGDFVNANSNWSAATPGNGNGVIDYGAGGGVAGENFGFWQQLALAGLIEGQYSGLTGANGNRHAIPGTNVPKGRMDSSGYYVEYWGTVDPSNSWFWSGPANNVMTFGQLNGSGPTENPIMTPEEAYNIDSKIDDGRPGLGSIQTYRQNGLWVNCVTSNAQTTTTYNISYSNWACQLTYVDFTS